MASASPPTQQHQQSLPQPPPPSGDPAAPARRRLASRACDRCRRRKAKCDFASSPGGCTHCRDANEQCTFAMPMGRRGPKTKRRQSETLESSPRVLSQTPLSPSRPLPPLILYPKNGETPTPRLGGISPSSGTASASAWPAPPRPLNLEPTQVLSPQTVHSSISEATCPIGAGTLQRWQTLSRSLAVRSFELEHIINRCFRLFFDYLFPLTPLVHEQSLREGLTFSLSYIASGGATSPPTLGHILREPWAGSHQQSSPSVVSGPSEHWLDATFTIITAVCAEAAFLLPKDLFPEGETVADVFLRASRACLDHYLEADLDSPNAISITIRYFHSNCLHAAGKPKYSWHIFGEATRLAQVMNLNDESSFAGLQPIEAELRRRAFWIVYMGDKSAAILNSRPITIHKYSFESGITTAYPTGIEDAGTPSSRHDAAAPPPRSFIAGFNANLRLWQSASDLILEMRLLQDQHATDPASPPHQKPALTQQEGKRLHAFYVRFITCLDDLPPYLQTYALAAAAGGPESSTSAAAATQSTQFTIQCANLQVSLHCLRMVVTQKFEDLSYMAPGVDQGDLRKTEIAREMLRVMREAPFWSLQVNGEPYVEKIRLIGASLLAIIHRNGDSPLSARAKGDFSVLLDILTRLDSKASDALRKNPTWVG